MENEVFRCLKLEEPLPGDVFEVAVNESEAQLHSHGDPHDRNSCTPSPNINFFGEPHGDHVEKTKICDEAASHLTANHHAIGEGSPNAVLQPRSKILEIKAKRLKATWCHTCDWLQWETHPHAGGARAPIELQDLQLRIGLQYASRERCPARITSTHAPLR